MTRIYDQPWNKGRTVGVRRALSQAEIADIRAHLSQSNIHDHCLFMVAIDTMLRASDLLKLKVYDIRFSNGVIRQSFPTRQRKTQSPVYPVLTPRTQKAITVWLQTSGKGDTDYLFTREKDIHGQPITVGFYRSLIKAWAEDVGIPSQDISAHSLRRSKATYLYEQGVTVELIGRLLGHKSPASTIRYLGIDESQAREAALSHDIFSPPSHSTKAQKPMLNDREMGRLAETLWAQLAPKLGEMFDEMTKKGRE